MRLQPTSLGIVLLAAFVLGSSACRREEIKTYTIAKSKEAPPPPSQLPPGHPPTGELPKEHPPVSSLPTGHPPVAQETKTQETAQAPTASSETALVWTVPPHWKAKALGAMRRGSYTLQEGAEEADLSIFVFPGAAGGTLDNINRWRSQISLPPLTQAQLADESLPLTSETGLELLVVDLRNSSGERILGALLPQGSNSWFFKLKGPQALLEKEQKNFIAFLKSVKQP